MKIKQFAKGLLIISGTVLILGAGGAYIAWEKVGPTITQGVQRGFTESLKINHDILAPAEATVVLDVDGKPLLTMNRQAEYYTSLEDINPYLKEGFVAVEDQRFYDHSGVDTFATIRAVVRTLQGQTEGGSTITQQLVRNHILEDADVSVNRKLAEMVVSQELEDQFSKDQILEAYLNHVYFGNGAYGIGAASRRYFDKDQKDLTPKEAAVIINLTNNPSLYDPYTNPEEAAEKAMVTLGVMKTHGVISEEEYNEVKDKTIPLTMGELLYDDLFTDNEAVMVAVQKAAEELAVADGFELEFWFDTVEDYEAYHQHYKEAIQVKLEDLKEGGYTIQTTIDPDVQEEITQRVRDVMDGQEKGLETSVSVVDKDGFIVALVGGRRFDDYNRAYLSKRQPGSTAKPLLVYAPAFERGHLPTDLIPDKEVPGYEYITNWYGSFSNENVSVERAFMESLNNPAMNIVVNEPVDVMLDKLIGMEFRHLHPSDYTHVIALGGMTNGASTLEMASGFSTLVNGGDFKSPTNVSQIKQGDTVLYDATHRPTKDIYTDSASYLTIEMMKKTAHGPTVHAPVLADNYPEKYQGVKTGTTDENRDSYLAGVNPHFAVATWVGYDDNQPLSTDQLRLIFPINKTVSEYLLEDAEEIDFEKPDSVKRDGDRYIVEETEEETSEELTTYAELEEGERTDSQEWNQSRIIEEEYRIVYGLSVEEEREREERVVDALERLRDNEFEHTSDYPFIQESITRIQDMITSVKNNRVKEDLQEDLSKQQDRFAERYAELVEAEADSEKERQNAQLQGTRREIEIKKEREITKLKLALAQSKQRIEEKITTGQDPTAVLGDMDSIIHRLNELGEPTGYYQVLTDGTEVVFIEGDIPNLEGSDFLEIID